jgi:hypothetical protein
MCERQPLLTRRPRIFTPTHTVPVEPSTSTSSLPTPHSSDSVNRGEQHGHSDSDGCPGVCCCGGAGRAASGSRLSTTAHSPRRQRPPLQPQPGQLFFSARARACGGAAAAAGDKHALFVLEPHGRRRLLQRPSQLVRARGGRWSAAVLHVLGVRAVVLQSCMCWGATTALHQHAHSPPPSAAHLKLPEYDPA